MTQAIHRVSRKLINLSALSALLFLAFACSEKAKTSDTGSENAETNEEVFTIVEEQPGYQGGMDAFYAYVKNEMNYPLFARNSGIEGRVFAQFVIDKDGSLTELAVVRGIGAGCDEEVARVLKNAGPFKPASQRGKNVRVRKILSVVFKIDKSKTNPDGSPQGIIIVEDLQSANGEMKVDATFTNGEWSGTVYSEQGEALPGANIVIAGTTSGTVSDLDGTFKLKASKIQELVISFVGYENVRLEGSGT